MCFSYRNQHITFLLLVVYYYSSYLTLKKRNYASHLHGVRYAKIKQKASKEETRVYLLVDRTNKHQYETGYMELKQIKLFFINKFTSIVHICLEIFIRRLCNPLVRTSTHSAAHWIDKKSSACKLNVSLSWQAETLSICFIDNLPEDPHRLFFFSPLGSIVSLHNWAKTSEIGILTSWLLLLWFLCLLCKSEH